jgi:hypothetical protein
MLRPVLTAVALILPGLAGAEGTFVTVDNYVRAETDEYLTVNAAKGVGVFDHLRDPVAVDKQTVIRMNRDTLYSAAVFDLTTPVTITMPDSGDRFMSMLVIDQDHYVEAVEYDPGAYTFTQEDIGTRYMFVMVRTFVDPNDPDDLAAAHALQDQLAVAQEDAGTLEMPEWDQESLTAVRGLLNQLAPYQSAGVAFGAEDEVDEVAHLIGTAVGWGANPPSAATYVFGQVPQNDGATAYTVTVGDVPVDGFWSVTVYNAEGFMEDPIAQASLNNVTAVKAADGSVTIRFGGDPAAENYLRIMEGWNYIIRLYRPHPEVIDGSWTFPALMPAE